MHPAIPALATQALTFFEDFVKTECDLIDITQHLRDNAEEITIMGSQYNEARAYEELDPTGWCCLVNDTRDSLSREDDTIEIVEELYRHPNRSLSCDFEFILDGQTYTVELDKDDYPKFERVIEDAIEDAIEDDAQDD